MIIEPGTIVRLTEAFKRTMAKDSAEHVREFGQCLGTVLGLVREGCPEVDVRWKPSRLKYAYHPKHLKVVSNVDQILVRRFLRHYNPWTNLKIPSGGFLRKMQEYPEVSKYKRHSDRDLAYHYGRIRFFMTALKEGRFVDPLEVDNYWSNFHVGIPIGVELLAGHHRLIAAALLKRETVSVYYSGTLKILNWLKGKSKTCPLA